MSARLAVIETHPIQYHAPMYRLLEQSLGISVTAIYGSDFSVSGYHDTEFGATFRWDTDLLSGYEARFLERVADGGARSVETVKAAGLSEQLRAVQPAAILLVGYSPRFHRDAFFAGLRAGVPLLFRGETTDHAVERSKLKHRARSLALRAYYARFRSLLYVGSRSRAHFLRLGVPSARLYFSPYCVDTTPFELVDAHEELRRGTRAECKIETQETVLLAVGKLSPRKGPDLLLSGAHEFSERTGKNLTVLFVGDGELREILRQSGENYPRTRVCFAGFQNQTQLSRFYHAADLLVLPSRTSETWGLVVNEALHHGLPCVVSDSVGCAPDLVTAGQTGEIFGADDLQELVGALGRAQLLVGNTGTREACRARANMYSMQYAAQGIAEAFHDARRGR